MIDVLAADVGAPGMDIVAVGDGRVFRVRWSDKQVFFTSGTNYLSVAVADALGTGQLNIVAGRGDGLIDILDPDTLTVAQSSSLCSGVIWSLQQHEPGVLAFTCGLNFGLYNPATQTLVTQTAVSGVSASEIGAYGSMVHATLGGKSTYLIGGSPAVQLIDIGDNDVPVMQPAGLSVHWRGSVDIPLTASDLNGDSLSFELTELPARGALEWANRANGILRYSVENPLKGTDTFSARAFDGFQYSTAQPITLTLTNTPPAANTTSLSFHWRGAQTARLGGNDANGDPVTFTITAPTQRGALTLSNVTTGDIQFVPSGAFVGSDTLTYQVADGADIGAAQTVQIALTNTAPVVTAASYDVTSNTVQARVNAQDANSDPMTYEIVQQATKGTFTLDAASGQFQYVPSVSGTGTDTVTVLANDGVSRSPAVALEFRYVPANSGRRGGGGSLEWLTVMLLLAGASLREHRRRSSARSSRCSPVSLPDVGEGSRARAR
jgi:hypothetical protein